MAHKFCSNVSFAHNAMIATLSALKYKIMTYTCLGTHLLQLKDVLIKVMLQTFISKINTELFKAIIFIIFKPKNIQNTNGQSLKNKREIRLKEEAQIYE
jgi:acyl-[acyl carrier protein]--UDP-N-acetylglucosamine O-acyltransferase